MVCLESMELCMGAIVGMGVNGTCMGGLIGVLFGFYGAMWGMGW